MRLSSLAALAVSAGVALAASQATAATFSGSWKLSVNQSDPGLVIGYDPNTPWTEATGGTFSFKLDAGSPFIGVDLFTVYTNEGTVNWCNSWLCGGGGNDDVQAKAVALTFQFNEPLPNSIEGPIGGVTNGQVHLFGAWQNGVLNWANDPRFNSPDNPANFNADTGGYTLLHFGPGTPDQQGLLSIRVNGGTFNGGPFGLNEGPENGLQVTGLFHWDRDPTGAVPEPTTWALMIGGFGLAGASLRRRKALAVA